MVTVGCQTILCGSNAVEEAFTLPETKTASCQTHVFDEEASSKTVGLYRTTSLPFASLGQLGIGERLKSLNSSQRSSIKRPYRSKVPEKALPPQKGMGALKESDDDENESTVTLDEPTSEQRNAAKEWIDQVKQCQNQDNVKNERKLSSGGDLNGEPGELHASQKQTSESQESLDISADRTLLYGAEEHEDAPETVLSQTASDEREELDLFSKLFEYFRGSPNGVEIPRSGNGTEHTERKEQTSTNETATERTNSKKRESISEMRSEQTPEGDRTDNALREAVSTVVAELSQRVAKNASGDETPRLEIAIDPLTGSFAVVDRDAQSAEKKESAREDAISEGQAGVVQCRGATECGATSNDSGLEGKEELYGRGACNGENVDRDRLEQDAAEIELDNADGENSETEEAKVESVEELGILGRMSQLINTEIHLALEKWASEKGESGTVEAVEELEEDKEELQQTKDIDAESEEHQGSSEDIVGQTTPTAFDRLFSLIVGKETSETVKEEAKEDNPTAAAEKAPNQNLNFSSQEGLAVVELVGEGDRPGKGDSHKLGFWDKLMQSRSVKPAPTLKDGSGTMEKSAKSPASSNRSPTSVAWSRFKGMFDNSKKSNTALLPEAPWRDGSQRIRRASELTTDEPEESMKTKSSSSTGKSGKV